MIWFGWVGFYCTSDIVSYLIPNPIYTYILDMIWFGYVGFYGISNSEGYLMPNPLYTCILNIYDLVWLGWVLWHIKLCRIFNADFSLYIYIKYI